jgi:S1-C subfamily serine protease
MKYMLRIFSAALLGSLLVATGVLIGGVVGPVQIGSAADGERYAEINTDLLDEQERVFAEVYDRVAPSVVSITTAASVPSSGGERYFNESTGSGFVIDTQGHIVTNFHVVDNAARVEINMFDGTITTADVVGLDPDSDIAVLKVNVPVDRLRPVPFADSNNVNVGQTVLAIGNPFQNNWTLTSGIVSATDRRIVGLAGFSIGGVIQTDAAINPGNSGGPLVNLQGEVVGVNSQIESGVRQNSGIGFAVPSNLVQRVADELIQNQTVRYSYLGIANAEINLDLIRRYELPNNIRGVAVDGVRAGFPAANGGLQNPARNSIDVITAIDGNPMRDFDQLVGYLAVNTTPGQTVNLTVYRNGQVLNLPVTLTARPGA